MSARCILNAFLLSLPIWAALLVAGRWLAGLMGLAA